MKNDSILTMEYTDLLDQLLTFPSQIKKSQLIVDKSQIPRLYDINQILILGHGPNRLAAELFKEFFKEKISIPINVQQTEKLPKWVNKHTLVFSLSHKEDLETITSCKEAIQKHSKIIVISNDKRLNDLCSHRELSHIYLPENSFSQINIGFLFFCILYSLQKTRLVTINLDDEIEECEKMLSQLSKKLHPSVHTENNQAKKIVNKLNDSNPVIFGWGQYSVVAKVWAMLFTRHSKLLSQWYQLFDCSPYCLDAWALQNFSNDFTSIIFRDHQLESNVLKKRLDFFEQLLQGVGIQQKLINPTGKSNLAKIFGLIYLGMFTSFYTAISHDIDPQSTPMYHQLKEVVN